MGFKAFSYLWVALKPAPKSEKRTKKRTNLSKAPDFCRYAKRKGVTSWQQFERTERTAKSFPIASRSVWNATHRASRCGAAYHLPPEKRHDDFCAFVNEIWFPLHICGNCKPTTTAYYKNIAKVITDYFKGCVLQEISPIQIQKYLIYLQTKYKTPQGKPLAPKSVRHHYGTLTNIFGYPCLLSFFLEAYSPIDRKNRL